MSAEADKCYMSSAVEFHQRAIRDWNGDKTDRIPYVVHRACDIHKCALDELLTVRRGGPEISEARLDICSQLYTETDMTVYDIAACAGYTHHTSVHWALKRLGIAGSRNA